MVGEKTGYLWFFPLNLHQLLVQAKTKERKREFEFMSVFIVLMEID